MKASIEGLELRKTDDPSAINVYLRDHPIGTVVHSVGRTTHGADRWYIEHPAMPLERTVANLEIEMIGRPDSLAGGRGKGWLTGFARSTMGSLLAAAGIPVVADARPDQHFFERSDNVAFALRGIPAHTLSSYNMHTDYHTPADDLSRVDLAHLARLAEAAARAARLLADGDPPVWNPGGRPLPPH